MLGGSPPNSMVRTGPAEHGKRRLFVEGGQSKEKQKRRVETLTKKEVERANKRVKSPVRVEERVGRKRSRSPSRMRDSVQNNFSKGLKQVLKSVEKKRAKARMRQAKYQKKLRATVGERSLLELCSIKEPQRRNYAKKVDEFYGFVSHHGLPLSTEEHLDEALCEYADELYLNGESVNAGEQLKAALEFDLPTAARGGSLVLPRFKRALKGWRRMAPNQTRLPMLEFLKSSISGVMIAAGHLEEALFNEVTFSTYTRPEGAAVRCGEEESGLPLRCHHPQPSRTGGVLEGRHLRRHGDPGRHQSTMARQFAGGVGREKGEDIPGEQHLEFFSGQVSRDLEKGRASAADRGCGHHTLPEQAWGSKQRSPMPPEKHDGHPTSRSMGFGCQHKNLQQTMNQYSDRLKSFGEEVRLHFDDFYRNSSIRLPPGLKKRAKEVFPKGGF